MMRENREGFEIDLQKLLMTYLSKWWLIVLCTAAAALIALCVTCWFITPQYKASVTVYVNNARSDQQVEYITSSNLATAQRLVSTYINMIESDTVLEKVANASGVNITADQIRTIMSASQVDDTELFNVFITHKDPALAAQIANAVAKVAPGEIERFVEGSSTKIIDYAKVPEEPSSPSLLKNTVLGALMGVVAALLYLSLRFLMDVRIKDEEDLAALFALPVLAQIPAFIPEGAKRRDGYGKNGYAYTAAEFGGGAGAHLQNAKRNKG